MYMNMYFKLYILDCYGVKLGIFFVYYCGYEGVTFIFHTLLTLFTNQNTTDYQYFTF